uniref:Uncharacterized protein n=1 Tax=Plectus sambesii TaxID=2011161 RepID=A0A914VI10_9BILA
MKVLLSLLLAGAVLVSANLDHFKVDELSSSFKAYELTISEGCDSEINSCIAEQHTDARACVEQWREHSGKYIDECHQDTEIAELSKTWQESSFHWHKAVDSCLQGKEPPTEAAEATMFLVFLKRKKRSSHSGHEHHGQDNSMGHEQCFKRIEEKAAVCNTKVAECAALAKCWGLGDAPSTETANELTWFQHIKQLRETTKTGMAAYKTKMMACVSQKRADDMNSLLKDSDMTALSSQFRLFNMSSSNCNPELWECIASLHQRALMCARLQQAENERSDKYEECAANEDIKQARKDWEKASGKWHKTLDMCLAGEAVPAEEEEAGFFLFRRKRSTEEEAPGPSHPHRHPQYRGHGPRVFANAAECWRDVGAHRRDCAMKAKECTEYAVCSGVEGTEVPEGKQEWFDRSKQLRERQTQTLTDYEKKLHDCLGTAEPAKAMEMNAEKKMNEETW